MGCQLYILADTPIVVIHDKEFTMSDYIILAGIVVLYMVIYAIVWSKTHPAKTVTKEVITEVSAPTVNVAEIVLEAFEGLATIFDENNIKSNTKAYKILHAQIDSLKDAE